MHIKSKETLVKHITIKSKYIHIFESFFVAIVIVGYINPLSANPTKWSSTLKQYAGKSRRAV